jgi:hypothetical protein
LSARTQALAETALGSRDVELLKLFSAIRALIREEVRDELRAARVDEAGDPVVPIDDRARCTRRQACALAPKIPGAIKIGKRWYARASAIDTALEAMGTPAKVVPTAAANDGDRDLLEELGLEEVAAPKRRGAR